MHFSKYPNKMPEVSSFEFFASQNIPQNIWFHSIFNIYERYTKSICRDIYVIRYQIYEDSVFTVHIFLRHLEISQMYLIHAPRDNFSHWACSLDIFMMIIKIFYIFSRYVQYDYKIFFMFSRYIQYDHTNILHAP